MDTDFIKACARLTDKQLAIFNAEMQRRHRSLGTAYLLLLMGGPLGIHQFYLLQPLTGLLYALLTVFGGFSLGLGYALSSTPGRVLTVLGAVYLTVLGLVLICDVITLPSQVRSIDEEAQEAVLERLVGEESPLRPGR